MNPLSPLRDKLTDESVAYGYTLTVWGSGAMLITQSNITPTTVLSLGGTIGYGLLSLIVFKSFFTEMKKEKNKKYLVASATHILASLGAVFISFLLIKTLPNTMNLTTQAFIIGANSTITYNLGLLTEELISKDLYQLEKTLTKQK
ncbi:MAG: hypothetical protein ABEI78_01000 [Candidatus Nanohaloarchaea archaeon]